MSTDAIYPLTFDPVFKDYIWGGRNLETHLGRTIPDGVIAESWEVAGHPDGSSTVNNGALSGLTLPQVQEKLGEALVGSRNRYALELERFPLLIKLLDANRWLSVQVHPDDEYGLAHEGDLGKTEMWLVVHAEAGAELIYGFKRGVSKAEFAAAIANGTTGDWLHRVPVAVGDVIFIPAGTIHALGPGAIVAEIQQNSNTTYRVYDWGRPRPIHVEQALDALDFSLIEPGPLKPRVIEQNGIKREEIGNCRYFQTERIAMESGQRLSDSCNGESFELWCAVDGSARVEWAGEAVEFTNLAWVLLPATLGDFSINATEECTLLRVRTPETF